MFGRTEKDAPAFRRRHTFGFSGWMFGELPITVFDHDDSRVYEDSDGQRQPAKRHDVRADVEVVHRDERRNDSDWQSENRNQRGTKMKKEENDDDADDDGFFEQVSLQRFDGGVNQAGAVVTGDDFDSGRQRGFRLRQLFLHAIDDGECVHAVTHDDDAGNGFPFPLPFGDSFADVRSEANGPQVAHEDGCSVLRGDRHHLQIVQGSQIAESADHVLCAAHLEQATADFICARPHFLDHGRKWNAVGAQLVGIEIDLILLDESADGRDFRDTRNCFELIPQVPVLDAAQFGETALVAAIHNHVFVHPPCSGCVRSNDGMNSRGKTPGDLLHVFENARARPIQIGPVFEDDENVGVTEHRLRPHCFDVRSGEKLGDDGIGNLVFDEVGRLSGPRRVHDDLNVRNVRQRIKRYTSQRPDSREHQQQRSREHQKTVLRAPINPSRDHVTFLRWRSR